MKKYNFMTIKPYDNLYILKTGEDEYLEMLMHIFDEGSYWTESVKKTLLDKIQNGVDGNRAIIEKKGDTILIMPQFVDDPEEYAIEIDKNVLLVLIEKWEALVKQKTPEIYFIRYDDGSIEIQDHLPAE